MPVSPARDPLYRGYRFVWAFRAAYTFAKHRRALRWRTPFQAVCDAWASDPQPFHVNPHHLIPKPNI